MITEKIDTAIAELGALAHQVSPEVWERLRLVGLQIQGIRDIAAVLEIATLALPVVIADRQGGAHAGQASQVQ